MSTNRNNSKEHDAREIEQNKILYAELEKYLQTSKKKGRRNKFEIYYEILNLIKEFENNVRPTHIQIALRTSYDKFTKYLDELERGKLIQRQPLVITDKGKCFLSDYEKLIQYIPVKNDAS